MTRSSFLLTGSLILGMAGLLYSIGLPAPPVSATPLLRASTLSTLALEAVAAPAPAPTVVDDDEGRAAPAAEDGLRRPAAKMERLIEKLAAACREDRADAIEEIMGEIREALAESDPEAERAFARAFHAGGPEAEKLYYISLTYPNYERRRTLRARLAEAAPPAPAAHPDYHDAGAVAAFLRGPHSSDEKVRVLNDLPPETLRSGPVRDCLVDSVLRSTRGGAVAATSLRLLRRGSRAEAEQVALRALDESANPAVRRAAVRLLGAVAGEDGTARLVTIVRDSASDVERRLAADALIQRPLVASAVTVLGQIAEDSLEDDYLRAHTIRALLAEVRRAGPAADAARAALRRVAHAHRTAPTSMASSTIRLLADVVE